MLTKDGAFGLIQDVVDSLHKTGLIDEAMPIRPETVLLGEGSPLDSIAFVTFVTEMEDRLSRQSGREVFISLEDIQALDIDNPRLDVSSFAEYVTRLN
jgi:hypothetical protein